MSTVKYPYNAPSMKSYDVKPVKTINHHRYHRHHGFSKYNARGVDIDGYHFDSHVEGSVYLFLKRHDKNFSMQTKFFYRYNFKYKSKIDGKILKLSNRSYRPDFIIYKPHVSYKPKTIYSNKSKAIKNIIGIIDVKGKRYMTPTASMRMDGFSQVYNLPVTIVRFDKGTYSFISYIKGYRKDSHSISILS